MIFIIALAAVAIVTVVYNRSHSYVVSLLLGLAVGSIIHTGSSLLLPTEEFTETTSYKLQPTTHGSDTEYFVGTGPNNSGEAYYAVIEGDSIKDRTGKADLVMVVQDGKKELIVEETKSKNLWLEPWTTTTKTRFSFHVPEGTYKENFTPDK